VFIGHNAIGFASKRAAPDVSLGWLMAAPLFLDLLWPIFLLLGWEQVEIQPGATRFTPLILDIPYSHSLVTSIGWSILFGGAYWLRKRNLRGAMVLASGVFSHWILDAITHRPDLPLYPGSRTMIGFGLWNSVAGTFIIEGAMFAVGLWLYLKTRRADDRTGRLALWSFVAFLLVIYVSNYFGPPPPSPQAIAYVSLLMWIEPLWCAWIDRHRSVSRER
jgi:LexA-binding, inner membrane-associated putative hydrolase